MLFLACAIYSLRRSYRVKSFVLLFLFSTPFVGSLALLLSFIGQYLAALGAHTAGAASLALGIAGGVVLPLGAGPLMP